MPIAYTDATGDASPIDLATIQIANDDSYLYLRLTYGTAVNPNSGSGVFLALDNDNNPAHRIRCVRSRVGRSRAGWQNDFPFEQATGVFNTGGGITGGAGAISPYFTTTTEQEYAISRSATFTASGLPGVSGNFVYVAGVHRGRNSQRRRPCAIHICVGPRAHVAGTCRNWLTNDHPPGPWSKESIEEPPIGELVRIRRDSVFSLCLYLRREILEEQFKLGLTFQKESHDVGIAAEKMVLLERAAAHFRNAVATRPDFYRGHVAYGSTLLELAQASTDSRQRAESNARGGRTIRTGGTLFKLRLGCLSRVGIVAHLRSAGERKRRWRSVVKTS